MISDALVKTNHIAEVVQLRIKSPSDPQCVAGVNMAVE
jgi:hypothetical protein